MVLPPQEEEVGEVKGEEVDFNAPSMEDKGILKIGVRKSTAILLTIHSLPH